MLVIGQPDSGKSTLIGQIVDCWCETHDNDSPVDKNGRSFSFDDESEFLDCDSSVLSAE